MTNSSIKYEVSSKENFYFYLKVFFTLLIVLWLFSMLAGISAFINEDKFKPIVQVLLFYITLIVLYVFFSMGLMIGYIRGNAIKMSKHQFPDIYETVEEYSSLLGLKKVPDIYLMQSGGILNAFATRFTGRNYIVIYSEILEEAYNKNKDAVEFIIGHELGHVKRNHLIKRFWTLPSMLIPFLDAAYSRACEYTCDNIGATLNKKGVRNGLVMLASGKKLYDKVVLKQFVDQENTEGGFWYWMAEKFSSHPHLSKRLSLFQHSSFEPQRFIKTEVSVEDKKMEDHSKYMPV